MAMWTEETEARWRDLSEEVMTGMKEWRLAHPRATFKEIETALDERLARVRARMLSDVALASAATNLKGAEVAERPPCPKCGHPLEHQETTTRTLTTNHDQTIELARSYTLCPACGARVFPPGR
jgi:YgiT-type zinc finger domain-containing protein